MADRMRSNFLQSLSAWSLLRLLGFVFFVFAPASILVMSPFSPERSWASILTFAGFGGLTAVGWLYACSVNKRVFWILIPSQAFWMFLPELFPNDFRTGFTFSAEGSLCVAMIVAGYVLFVSFVRTEGLRTIRMETELSLAQQIHSNLIPPIVRSTPQLELYGRSMASTEMGGDLIDVIEGGGRTDLFIADVSGHGVKAGVIMAVVKSAIRTRRRTASSVHEVFRDVNHVVCELAGPGMFVTAACMRVGPGGTAEFCGAGHGPVLHFRRLDGTVAAIEGEHLPFGVLEGEEYQARELRLGAGDVLLFMTDGLTEVFDRRGRMLGQGAIEVLFRDLAEMPLDQVFGQIMDAVGGHGPQGDDQTLLLARVR